MYDARAIMEYGISLIWTPMGQEKVSLLVRSEVSSFQRLQEWYLGWEKVSCLERCPQFRSVLIYRERGSNRNY